jgi:hypothetical protein
MVSQASTQDRDEYTTPQHPSGIYLVAAAQQLPRAILVEAVRVVACVLYAEHGQRTIGCVRTRLMHAHTKLARSLIRTGGRAGEREGGREG